MPSLLGLIPVDGWGLPISIAPAPFGRHRTFAGDVPSLSKSFV